MSDNDWSSKRWWAVPAAGFLILAILCLFFAKPPEERSAHTTYDASFEGTRAVYLLLEELHYPVIRSKRPTGGAVKWVLFPTDPKKDVDVLDGWVRAGGAILLADATTAFAENLGITLTAQDVEGGELAEAAHGLGVTQLVGGKRQSEWSGHTGRVVVEAGGAPFLTVYPHGRGEVWLANRPEFLQNRLIGQADNGTLVCRLAETMLEDRPGKLAVDEYFHGMRDRPGVVELLLEPPALPVTLQGLVVMGLLLWHYMPRFGNIRSAPAVRRRSKTEFLEAMASLLERKGDFTAAYATVRDDLIRAMEQEMGLPPGTPIEELAREAARRRHVNEAALAGALAPGAVPPGARRTVFLKALNDLETRGDEFFHGRHHR